MLFLAPFGVRADECEDVYNRKKYVDALAICLQVANKGDAAAHRLLSTMYQFGRGTNPDIGKARYHYDRYREALEKHLDNGDTEAMYKLGDSYLYGDTDLDIKPNPAKGLELLERAGLKGHRVAQLTLMHFYREGNVRFGIERSLLKAMAWAQRAAEENNDKVAHALLGDWYSNGVVRKEDGSLNYVAAYKHYILGHRGINGSTKGKRNMLAKEMTPEQVEESRVEAAKWRAQYEAKHPPVIPQGMVAIGSAPKSETLDEAPAIPVKAVTEGAKQNSVPPQPTQVQARPSSSAPQQEQDAHDTAEESDAPTPRLNIEQIQMDLPKGQAVP